MTFRFALTCLLAGCLGKPAAPAADDAVDAPTTGCPAGTTAYPSELVIRSQTMIADLDGNGREDLVLWGREAGGTGRASVFVALSREPLVFGCYDLALPLGNVEPLDVWAGDVTGDGNADLVVAMRDATTYPIHLYRGSGGGVIEPVPDIQAPIAAQYGSNVGGMLTDSLPVFVLPYRDAGTEVIFGGLNEPFAGLLVTTTLEHDVLVRDDATPAGALTAGQYEELGVQGTDPQRLIAFGNSEVFALANVARDAGTSRFQHTGQTMLHGPGPQAVRFLREPLDMAMLAVTEANEGDFDLVRVEATGPPEVMLFPADIDRMNVRDLALANVDDSPGVDFVVLAQTSVNMQLTVFRDLVLADPASAKVAIQASLPLAANLLAVGNFDGEASTPDQILVLSTTGATATCHHVVAGAPQACVVPCDVAECP
ncbi:MAG: VCBS repeat-containing protein [Kofleriaceae bacterium]